MLHDCSQLNAAIIGIQPRAIIRLLAAGADPLRLPAQGSIGPKTFPLATAAVQNHPAVLKAFHSAGVAMAGPTAMTVEGWSVVHLVAWGKFLPRKIGRGRAMDYILGDKDGPKLDPNIAATGPADDWVEPAGGEWAKCCATAHASATLNHANSSVWVRWAAIATHTY